MDVYKLDIVVTRSQRLLALLSLSIVNYSPRHHHHQQKSRLNRHETWTWSWFTRRKFQKEIFCRFALMTHLFAGEENRCSGETQLKISCSWFAHRLGRRNKVQKIVNELEGQSEIFPVLEGGFDERRVGSRDCGGLTTRRNKEIEVFF